MLIHAAMLICGCGVIADTPAADYFRITVRDEQTHRGVPLVELRTVNNIRCFTDSAGVVAFNEPGLMDQTVFLHVSSHGYEYPKEGFGYRGTALKVTRGGSAVIRIKRLNIAERLYRVTGGGIYRDSVLLGDKPPTEQPVLNGLVLGQDSVLTTLFHGKMYWFWGDTNRPAYPLGNFQTTGATSLPPNAGGLDPSVGVNLQYFTDEHGFARQMAPVAGDGPTWIDGLITLNDGGTERMFAAYAKVRSNMEAYQRGLLEFDLTKNEFRKVIEFDLAAPAYPRGHPFKHSVDGVECVYFAAPYPLIRVRTDPKSLQDPSAYEAFTCLEPGTRLDKPRIDRTGDGAPRYAWKKNTPPVGALEQTKLIQAGLFKPQEALLQLRDVETDKLVTAHAGSVNWNSFRRRWVMITAEVGGTSYLGEVWYAEADTPIGPWVYALKIVTHDRYSYYNPKQHPMFDQEGGRLIYFEGTYASTFSGNADQTPRYDYNQVMYRLDLDDPRVMLPVPVYDVSNGNAPRRLATGPDAAIQRPRSPVVFFAPDRPRPGTVAIYARRPGSGDEVVTAKKSEKAMDGGDSRIAFYAIGADAKNPPATTVPLYEFVHADGVRRRYSTDVKWFEDGFERRERPVCRVWRNPLSAPWPAP